MIQSTPIRYFEDSSLKRKDKHDDAKIGVKSTALAWGDQTLEICKRLNYGMSALFTAVGYVQGLNLLYYPAMLWAQKYLHNEINRVNLDDRDSCAGFFLSNRIYGFLLTLAFLIGMFGA